LGSGMKRALAERTTPNPLHARHVASRRRVFLRLPVYDTTVPLPPHLSHVCSHV
jgi:hypothetical protein